MHVLYSQYIDVNLEHPINPSSMMIAVWYMDIDFVLSLQHNQT